MNHKYLLLFAVLACLTTNVLGQSRTSGASVTVQAKSAKLRSATGWKQNAQEVWIPNQNAISDIQLDESTRKSVAQNFLWIQFFSVTSPAQPYYVFLYENENYVAGIQPERRVNFFVMDGGSYTTFLNTIKNRNAETTAIYSSMYGYMSDKAEYSAAALLNIISERIASPSKGQYVLLLNAQRVDNMDVVRFRLPEMTSEFKNNTLNDNYFEASWSDVNTVILPISVVKPVDEFELGEPQVNAYSQPAIQNQPVAPVQTQSVAQPRVIVPAKEIVRDDDFGENTTSSTFEKQFIAQTIAPGAPSQATRAAEAVSAALPLEDKVADRVSVEKPIISEPIAILSAISEHYLSNKTGEWVTEQSPDFQFETVRNYEIRDYRYKNIDYLLLTKNEQYAGASHILVRKDDYQNQMSQLSTGSIIKIPVVAHSGIANTVADMSMIGEKAINKVVSEHKVIFKETYMILQFKLSQEKNLARFFLYLEDCSRYGTASKNENCQPQTSRKIKYGDANLLGTDQLFNKMYYETAYDGFIQFLQKPISSINATKSATRRSASDF